MGKQDPNSKLGNASSPFPKQESSITLKVFIHCEGCKRKVKRIIRCVDGVESCEIESGSGKVIVFGRGIDSKALLQSLHKAGKHAELWSSAGGGSKQPAMAFPGANNMNLPVPSNKNDKHNNSSSSNNTNVEKNKMKALAFEKLLEDQSNAISNNPKGKGNNDGSGGSGGTDKGGHKNKGGDMVELADLGTSGPMSALPPSKPTFPSGNHNLPAAIGPFEKSTMTNIPVLSKSMAPRPAIYHGEASYMSSSSNVAADDTEYGTAEYATHLFSDENANNCRIM